jgi:hypothetical protein
MRPAAGEGEAEVGLFELLLNEWLREEEGA